MVAITLKHNSHQPSHLLTHSDNPGIVQAHQQQQYGLLQDCQAHMGVVEAQAGGVFGSCFQLLSRVSEVDSMVRVLHLVTVMLEALGPKAQPHFAAITAALPQVHPAPAPPQPIPLEKCPACCCMHRGEVDAAESWCKAHVFPATS